jgi:hypothetical protein
VSRHPAKAWTSPADLRARVSREWESGKIPASLIGGPAAFPLRIKLKGPTSSELSERFAESREWVTNLEKEVARPGYRLESATIQHRTLGKNELPEAAVFDRAEDALAFIGKKREAARLARLASFLFAAFPALLPWALGKPLILLEREEEWPAIVSVLSWFATHPRSGLFVRQIDAEGAHTKFVETRLGLLSELLDIILPPDAVEQSAADRGLGGAAIFARRYGLREKPRYVRLRPLDAATGIDMGHAGGHRRLGLEELGIRSCDFARLYDSDSPALPREVFITENEINFLSFPARSRSIVVFGSGYGFASLASADWLHRCRVRYWGDLDTHGFAILDQLRASFPKAESFLMDRATLLAHRGLWTAEGSPTKIDLARLDEDERELYDDLRYDRLAPSLRLEQERIAYGWLETALRE